MDPYFGCTFQVGLPKKGCTDFPLLSEVFHNPLVSLARLRLAFSPFARFMAGALAAVPPGQVPPGQVPGPGTCPGGTCRPGTCPGGTCPAWY